MDDAAGDDSEGEEGDAQAAVDGALTADNGRLRGEVSRHKAQLEALRAKDPEFYAYLQVLCCGGGGRGLWGQRSWVGV